MTVPAVRVAIEQAAYSFDRLFDYAVPQDFALADLPGCRVTVPFGRGNTVRTGIVLSALQLSDDTPGLKQITGVLDEHPVLNDEALQMVLWLKQRYFCTYWDALRLLLPAGLGYRLAKTCTFVKMPEFACSPAQQELLAILSKAQQPVEEATLLKAAGLEEDGKPYLQLVQAGCINVSDTARRNRQDTVQKSIRLTGRGENEKLSVKQQQVVQLLGGGEAAVREVLYFTGVTKSVLDALVKKDVAQYFDVQDFRLPKSAMPRKDAQDYTLSADQQTAYARLCSMMESGTACTGVLYGVTGSGKTQVYLRLIDRALQLGTGVIVMVPEISLTPQLLQLFESRYGEQIAVFHSAVSMVQRMDAWKRVRMGKAKIAIGTRSAVFAPFEKLGLIILDEEQEYTYKSEASPRFHAAQVARYRCAYHKALCVLASATPGICTYYRTTLPPENPNHYTLSVLHERFGDAVLPKVDIVDMNEERAAGNTSAYSSVLLQALRENLAAGRQSILLLNRRGYHTYAVCSGCKEVLCCPNCSISLTYHSDNNRLMCHYCGYSVPFTQTCPNCGSEKVRYSGTGTQRAEDEISALLPGGRVLRMDTDCAGGRLGLEQKLTAFAQGEYDLIVGTQMVAKGLNFPSVTLVGVLSADQALFADDYRSEERAFDLLTQVVGRSGRGSEPGRAIIQTTAPENPVISLAAQQDYPSFYQREIQFRRAMLYPPFSDICVVGFSGEDRQQTEDGCMTFFAALRQSAKTDFPQLPLRILTPSAAGIVKVNGRYRYKIVMKCRNTGVFRQMLAKQLEDFSALRQYKALSVFADCDPDLIL